MSINLQQTARIHKQKSHKTVVPCIDMHLHFVTFLQATQGFDTLLDSMQEGNIKKNIVFGLPVKKKWESFEPREPHYYLGDNARCIYYNATDELLASEYLKLSDDDKKLIAPTLCGFDPTDMACIDYVEMMFEKYPFWSGIGELLLRHDDLTNLTIGETARANHPALEKVYEFCTAKGLPVCLHQNSTAVSSSLTPDEPYIYKHEMVECLEKHPYTKFIWAHCGVSRRVQHPLYHEMVAKMLKRYPNLHVDLSWVVYDNTICYPRQHDDDPYVPKEAWIDLIEEFQDRIMLGSDLCGHFDRAPDDPPEDSFLHGKTMARYNALLDKLHDNAKHKIAELNAEKMYFNHQKSTRLNGQGAIQEESHSATSQRKI